MKVDLSTPNIKNTDKIFKKNKQSYDTGWVSTGPICNEFEECVKEYTGAKHAIAVSSGTAALHLSYYATGVRSGDEVIVPTLTFIATINPIIYLGASPIFMDSDETLNIDIAKVEKFLKEETYQRNGNTYNSKTDAKIAAISVVHIFGNVVDMDKLNEVLDGYNIKVIEDAAESLGSFFEDGVHSGLKSDVGIFSFNANKIITTGSGGMVVTNNEEIANEIRYISQQSKDDNLRFYHNNLGFNYRMSDLLASLGLEQMSNLKEFKKKKIENYKYYSEKFKDNKKAELMKFKDENQNYWFYNLKLSDKEAYDLVLDLEKFEIQTRPLWQLSHQQKFLNNYQTYELSYALKVYPKIISIPCSTHLTKEQIEYVVQKIEESL